MLSLFLRVSVPGHVCETGGEVFIFLIAVGRDHGEIVYAGVSLYINTSNWRQH